MEAKINENGLLEIKRTGKWKRQYCPYQQETQYQPIIHCTCSDCCPHFQEHPRHIEMTCGCRIITLEIVSDERSREVEEDKKGLP